MLLAPLGLATLLVVASCARYEPRPISPTQSLEDFEARRLDAAELGTFLEARGEVTTWPPRRWDLRTLTLASFYYSPALDVARAQWGVAQGGLVTAGTRPNPSVSVALGRNTTTDPALVTPWITDVALELPLDVAGKRGIRMAEARQRSEVARLAVITEAWRVRSRVRSAYLGLYLSAQKDSVLTATQAIQRDIAAILDRWHEVGEASSVEVTRARIDLANSRVAASDAALRKATARSELADAVGVPPSALEGADFAFDLGSDSQPFYSRRIGLAEDRTEIPILGGARVLGKSGGTTVGAMLLRTEATASDPVTDHGVLRWKKDVLGQSSLGTPGGVVPGSDLFLVVNQQAESRDTFWRPLRTTAVTKLVWRIAF